MQKKKTKRAKKRSGSIKKSGRTAIGGRRPANTQAAPAVATPSYHIPHAQRARLHHRMQKRNNEAKISQIKLNRNTSLIPNANDISIGKKVSDFVGGVASAKYPVAGAALGYVAGLGAAAFRPVAEYRSKDIEYKAARENADDYNHHHENVEWYAS